MPEKAFVEEYGVVLLMEGALCILRDYLLLFVLAFLKTHYSWWLVELAIRSQSTYFTSVNDTFSMCAQLWDLFSKGPYQ